MSIKPGAMLWFFVWFFVSAVVTAFLSSLGWNTNASMLVLLFLTGGISVAAREVNELHLHFVRLREAAVQLDPSLATRPESSMPMTLIPFLLLIGMLAINAFIALVVGPLWWVMCLLANLALGAFGVAFTFSQLQRLHVKDRLKLLYLQFCCAGAAFCGLPLLLQLEGAPSWLVSSLIAFSYIFLSSAILLRALIWLNIPWLWRFIRMLYFVSSMHRDAPTPPAPPVVWAQEPIVEEAGEGRAPGTEVALSVVLRIVTTAGPPAQSLKQEPEAPLPLYPQGYQPTTASQLGLGEVYTCSSQELSQGEYERPHAFYPEIEQPQA